MKIHRTVLIGYFLLAAQTALAQEVAGEPRLEPVVAGEKSAQADPDLIRYALSLIGVNYKYGGKSPETGLDCSGFVGHVFRQAAGLSLPHSALALSRIGRKISVAELQPGDLVFYRTLPRAFSHVGIYLGENRFIHASSNSTGNVMISSMTEEYWARRFNGARRLSLW